MKRQQIAIPYRPAAGRPEVLRWLRRRLQAQGFDPITVTDGGKPGDLWNKPRAINRAARELAGDVLVFLDGDCVLHPDLIREGIRVVAEGAPWCVPFEIVYRLTQEATEKLLHQDAAAPLAGFQARTEHVQTACQGGGLVIVRREAFEAVGGFDERFDGWGGEDSSFGFALALLVEEAVNLPGTLIHLWHPEADRSRYWDQQGPNKILRERYRLAYVNRDPDAMRALIAERSA